jgi:Sulfotransferase family
MMKTEHIPFFFIVGRPRTGTTLLLKMFDAHPNVIIPWECQFILNLYPKYGKIKHWDEQHVLSFFDDLQQTWQFKFWNVDLPKLRTELLSCVGEISYGELCKHVHLSNKSVYPKGDILLVGDKNPGYTIYIDRLIKIYPDAKFIFINRDYRDNFYSIRNVDFELPLVSIVVYKWKYFFKKALAAKQKYPSSVFILKYEDLAMQPQDKFKEICDFVGLEYREEVFDFYKSGEASDAMLKTERAKKHHQSLLKPINTGRINLWKKNLSEAEIKQADYVAGKYAELGGYQREYTHAGFRVFLQTQPGILYARTIYFLTYIVDKFPYKTRALILNKGPLFLVKVFMNLFRKEKK